jgi:acetylornithine deacetylase/succinyl-diaminopimelate desuccinylase-like protein
MRLGPHGAMLSLSLELPRPTRERTMDTKAIQQFVDQTWNKSIVPAITEYIRIPNKSPFFDPNWVKNGHMEKAVALVEGWCKKRAIAGLTVEVVRLPNRTPLIYMEIPGTSNSTDTVLLYGHLDKQPEFTGWEAGLGPWEPVMKGDRLYGRGGADDGYAAFASLTAIEALKRQALDHARCVVLIEACEESGSYDLPAYIEHLEKRIGDVSLVVCLDSGCGNYDQLWSTTSLRGLIAGDLTVEVLREGVHSGDASGIVPSSFRILRTLLSRIEDENNGEILLKDLHVKIPAQRLEQAKGTAKVLKNEVWSKFPLIDGLKPMGKDNVEKILNRTWKPTLSITGVDGIPALSNAGNVLRPKTTFKLSVRVPPTCDAAKASAKLKETLEKKVPYGAKVTFTAEKGAAGWNAPELASWLETSVDKASKTFFGKGACYMGEGGSIPFMGMLGKKFPKAQFLITGVLGPQSNAHGPNEFLHVPTGKKLTCCVAQVVHEHSKRNAPAPASGNGKARAKPSMKPALAGAR